MATLVTLAEHYNYVVTIFLMMAGHMDEEVERHAGTPQTSKAHPVSS